MSSLVNCMNQSIKTVKETLDVLDWHGDSRRRADSYIDWVKRALNQYINDCAYRMKLVTEDDLVQKTDDIWQCALELLEEDSQVLYGEIDNRQTQVDATRNLVCAIRTFDKFVRKNDELKLSIEDSELQKREVIVYGKDPDPTEYVELKVPKQLVQDLYCENPCFENDSNMQYDPEYAKQPIGSLENVNRLLEYVYDSDTCKLMRGKVV